MENEQKSKMIEIFLFCPLYYIDEATENLGFLTD
jgi:hypothetical protein